MNITAEPTIHVIKSKKSLRSIAAPVLFLKHALKPKPVKEGRLYTF